ncbi:MAG: eIF2A-related protein [Candidatus Helarchaeota archaeon]
MQSILLKGHAAGIACVSWAPDSKHLISLANDNNIRIWDTAGNCLHTIDISDFMIDQIRWAPQGKYFAAIGRKLQSNKSTIGFLRIWSETGELISNIRTNFIRSFAWSPDGHYLATGLKTHKIRIWTYEGQFFKELKGHQGEVYALAWSPTKNVLASASHQLFLWNDNGTIIVLNHRSSRGDIIKIRWAPDGNYFTSFGNKQIIIWNAQGEQVSFLKDGIDKKEAHIEPIIDVAWSPDSHYLISAAWDRTILIWDRAGTCHKIIRVPDSRIDLHPPLIPRSIGWDPRGSLFTTTYNDGLLRFWTLEGDCIGTGQLNLIGPRKADKYVNPLLNEIHPLDYDYKFQWAPNGKSLAIWEDGYESIILLQWLTKTSELKIPRPTIEKKKRTIKTEPGEMVCSICYEPIEQISETYTCYYCKTKFHVHCLLEWITESDHKMCPKCNNLFISILISKEK